MAPQRSAAAAPYIYLHCRPDGTPFYVGKGQRRRSHCFATGRSGHHRNIVAKYGRELIKIFVFPCVSHEEAAQDEARYIRQFRADGFELCNQTDGGEGSPGYRHTAAALERMSRAKRGRVPHNKGVPLSEDTKRKLSLAMTGRTQTPEHRAKVAAALLGNKHNLGNKASAETRAKRSASLRGMTRTDETKARMSAAQKGNKKFLGHRHTAQTKDKMSNTKKLRNALLREAGCP